MNLDEHRHRGDPLSVRQREVMQLIVQVVKVTGEPPSVRQIARRLDLHHATVEQHLHSLHTKGWLSSPSPEGLRCIHFRG